MENSGLSTTVTMRRNVRPEERCFWPNLNPRALSVASRAGCHEQLPIGIVCDRESHQRRLTPINLKWSETFATGSLPDEKLTESAICVQREAERLGVRIHSGFVSWIAFVG
jgi:hypothetical protein